MRKTPVVLIVGLMALTACVSARTPGTEPSPSPSTSTSASPDPAPSARPDPTPSRTPKSPTPTTTTASTKATQCATAKGGQFDPSNMAGAQLVDVRVGSHGTYDRVTFEFTGQRTVPGFAIRTVTKPRQDGSGELLLLEGSSYAEIVFQHASGYDLSYQPTYKGPMDFVPNFPDLAEVRQAGDFERVVSWAVGVNHSACWHVMELENPVRLAVDFSH
jgi:hypothetical protein